MTVILNNRELANTIAGKINEVALEYMIHSQACCAGSGIEVDGDCNRSYSRGIKLTEEFRQHLERASGFISQVSEKLEEADRRAGINNQLIPDMPWNKSETGLDGLKTIMSQNKKV